MWKSQKVPLPGLALIASGRLHVMTSRLTQTLEACCKRSSEQDAGSRESMKCDNDGAWHGFCPVCKRPVDARLEPVTPPLESAPLPGKWAIGAFLSSRHILHIIFNITYIYKQYSDSRLAGPLGLTRIHLNLLELTQTLSDSLGLTRTSSDSDSL